MDPIRQLKKLANKLKKEKSKISTLRDAGILDKNNEFTKPYKNLNKIFKNEK